MADNKCILVAEDAEVNARHVTTLLKVEGYDVHLARDGEECLQMAKELIPDMLLLDLMMPKIDGLTVLKALRDDEATRDIRVAVCSAKDFSAEIGLAQELGVCQFIVKPFENRDLLEVVDNLLHDRCSTSKINREDFSNEGYDPDLRKEKASYKLWGTRGSIPVSGPRSVRYGGNTTCFEMSCGDDRVIIDAGSGIRDLGLDMMADGPRKIHLFFTHTHWDHIQGFPFFTPAYVPGFDVTVYAPHNIEKSIESIFRGQLDSAYFPVQMEDMSANLNFVDLPSEPVRIGKMEVTWEYALHPSPTVGYKITVDGRSLVFMPDNEFLKGYLGDPNKIARDDTRLRQFDPMIEFMQGVDIAIHEAQYTPQEYKTKIGWGHTSISNAALFMKIAEVKQWVVTHHDPLNDDVALQNNLLLTRQILEDIDCDIEVRHGYDGMVGYL